MVYICADDYGISKESCARIEKCAAVGALNKISVLPNGIVPNKEKVSDLKVKFGLHINLVEGRALSAASDIPLLADENGYFRHSFAGLFLLSVSHKRKKFEKQLETELRSQIEFWRKTGLPYVIDSHQHTHMIPLVFGTLLKVLSDMKVDAEYIRFPSEPTLPYIKCLSLYPTYRPVNIIKQLILKFLGLLNKTELKRSGIKTALFMGIMFSGRMDKSRVEKVIPQYIKIAEKKNSDIEILFHPGYMLHGEKTGFSEKFSRFYFSKDRKTEYDTLQIRKGALK